MTASVESMSLARAALQDAINVLRRFEANVTLQERALAALIEAQGPAGIVEIRGPMTDRQRAHAMTVYSNHGGDNPKAALAAIQNAAVNAYINGHKDREDVAGAGGEG